jgi:shikimate dehydrogenase
MKISGKAKIAGVIGNPIDHSLSPKLHNYWLEKYEIDGAYIPISVEKENFSEVFKALPKMGFIGVNITVPYKVDAYNMVDEVSKTAKKIGAVNMVIFDKKTGASYGTNTDAYGFLLNIEKKYEGLTQKGPVVVYGAGGAARAVCAGLVEANAPEIRLVNRTQEKALMIKDELNSDNIKVESWAKRSFALKNAKLVVNTTSVGMKKGEELPIDFTDLAPDAVVTDIIYNPLKTKFIRRAGARGNRTIDGLGMLLYQAQPAFKAWFDKQPEVNDELRNYILKS